MKKHRPYVEYCRQRFALENGCSYSYEDAEAKLDEFYVQVGKQRLVQIRGEIEFQKILSGSNLTNSK